MHAPERENPYDGLVPGLLPSTAGMELDYRTIDSTDKEARHAALRFFLATGGVGALLAFTVRAIAETTATSLFLSIVALLMTLHVISLYLNGVPRAALIGWAVLGPALWLFSNGPRRGFTSSSGSSPAPSPSKSRIPSLPTGLCGCTPIPNSTDEHASDGAPCGSTPRFAARCERLPPLRRRFAPLRPELLGQELLPRMLPLLL